MKDLGLASAFFLAEQVSQANFFVDADILLVFTVNSFHESGRT